MNSNWWIQIALFLLVGWEGDGALIPAPEACTDEQLKKCADSAEPLYKDSDLVVPDNPKSVEKVCTLWNNLASCIRGYTSRCMTRQQKTEFDKAFKDPSVSMSTLCQDQDYQKAYLHHAPCVKKISTQASYCGNQYRYLIDLVSGGSANIKQICCARAKFRTCISQKTPDKCDSRVTYYNTNQASSGRYKSSGGAALNATTLALSILDKSLSIVSQQCASLSTFREAECPGIDQSALRRTNKGPIVGPELVDSAETAGSAGESLQSTNFQLDQPRPSKYGSQEGTMQTPPRPTTNGGGNEIPKTDKLSSGSARSNNKRGSDSEESKSSAMSFVNNIKGIKQSGVLVAASIGFLYSLAHLLHP